MTTKTERLDSWRELADELMLADKPVYIRDINDEYYFGHILFCGEKYIELECFAPKLKSGKKYNIRWLLVSKFDEYKGDK